jgi:uncharacterized membrane protein YfcA
VLVAGFLVGAINAIGGGGMLIGFPVLLLFGMPALAANATANVIVLSGQITSSFGYKKHIKALPKSYFWLILPTAIGAAIGAYILRRTSNTNFELVAPILIIISVVLFAYQPYIHARIYRQAGAAHTYSGPKLWVFMAIFPLAIYGGYFGAGYGLVMLAILSLTRLTNIHQMNGLKNLTAIAISGVSIIVLYSSHLINWKYAFAMGIGTAIGGYVGARNAQRFSFKFIRIFVLVIGLITAVYLTTLALS